MLVSRGPILGLSMKRRIILVLAWTAIIAAIGIEASRRLGGSSTHSGPGADSAGIQDKESYLNEKQRVRLFDLEHANLRLGKALGPMTAAISGCDQGSLEKVLASDFSAKVPSATDWADLPADKENDFRFVQLASDQQVDRAGFVEWVEKLKSAFKKIETVSFPRDRNDASIIEGSKVTTESEGVFRIAGIGHDGGPVEMSGRFSMKHLGMDESFDKIEGWIQELTLHNPRFITGEKKLFEETTKTSGFDVASLFDHWKKPKEFQVLTGGVYLGDVNGDDHLDALVTDFLQAFFYLGKGDGTFTKVDWKPIPYKHGGLTEHVNRLYGAIFDATGDGEREVLCGGYFYSWDEAKQTLVPVPGALRIPNVDLALGDYDRDGLTDMYLMNCGAESPSIRVRSFFDEDRIKGLANVLYRNLGNGQFEDVTAAAGASPAFGRGYSTVFFYANDDDYPDILVLNEFGRNCFLINNGDGTFHEVDEIDKVFGGFSMGACSGDIDGDGRTDIYVSNMYSKAGHRIFHHLDMSLYPEKARPMFMSSINGNRLYRARGDLTFADLGKQAGVNSAGWGWSGAMADFDLNGWLDLYAPCGHRSVDRGKPDG